MGSEQLRQLASQLALELCHAGGLIGASNLINILFSNGGLIGASNLAAWVTQAATHCAMQHTAPCGLPEGAVDCE